ncbi:MAG: FIST C-terminal domain-containing protein [Deltaproteobacteria bacterium]|nr:FIST C-terminal domain-containing protein [Deltaproteobacteria bacterium]
MKIAQRTWSETSGWQGGPPSGAEGAQLVLLFGGTKQIAEARWLAELRNACPSAHLFGCSTAGEIAGTTVTDDHVVASAVTFERTPIKLAQVRLSEGKDSLDAGARLAAMLPGEGLRHVFVISDGSKVNGSELVRGLLAALPKGVQVTGGLAGDGARFERTLILAGETPLEGSIGAVGLYGDAIKVGYGSLGGWDPFGPERAVTRSEGNVLYQLDGKPALELYKSYLGEHASGLPATGLLFPLQIRRKGDAETLVRTILSVDEQAGSMTFAGDVPLGATAQLMKANFDRLVDGASGAAKTSAVTLAGSTPELAVLISCVGRKLVLKQRTEEEVEAVEEVLGKGTPMTGFYSYGEICPAAPNASCQLHNQTMTITTFSER